MNYNYEIQLKSGIWVKCSGRCYYNWNGNKRKQ